MYYLVLYVYMSRPVIRIKQDATDCTFLRQAIIYS